MYRILPYMFSPEVMRFFRGVYALSIVLLLSSWDTRTHVSIKAPTQKTAPEHNVRLVLSKDYKTSVYSSLKTEIDPPKKRDPVIIMEQEKEKESVKRELISRLSKIVPLTKHGMLYLARYDSTALEEMIKSGNRSIETTDPFRYLCHIGEKYTKKLDMEWYHQHRERNNIAIDDKDFISTIRLELMRMNLKVDKEKKRAVPTEGKSYREDPHPARHHAPGPWKPVEWDCGETPSETIDKLREYVQENESNQFLDIMLGKRVIA